MNYGNPKILPSTGAGVLLAGTLLGQFFTVLGIIFLAGTIGVIIRYFFRRNKNINE